MSDTVILAIVAVLASLLGLVVGKFGDRAAESQRWQRELGADHDRWLTERDAEHERWLRERRANAYALFLAKAEQLYVERKPPVSPPADLEAVRALDQFRLELSAALAQIEIFGSTEASDLANRMVVMVTNPPEGRVPSRGVVPARVGVCVWVEGCSGRDSCRHDLLGVGGGGS